jgi:hypothetical protein
MVNYLAVLSCGAWLLINTPTSTRWQETMAASLHWVAGFGYRTWMNFRNFSMYSWDR